MNEDLARRAAAEARAAQAALAIAAKANWQVERPGPTLSTPFANYLYAEVAQLLLVPTSAGLPFARRLADRAMREARSDALVVSHSHSAEGLPRTFFALGRWFSTSAKWTVPAWPWLSRDGGLWFSAPTRRLDMHAWPLRQSRLQLEAPPWGSSREQDAGRARAIGWLDQLLA